MSLIKVGSRVFNSEAIEFIELGPIPTMLETVLNQVEITLLSGKKLTFNDEEADKVREHILHEAKDLLKPRNPLSTS